MDNYKYTWEHPILRDVHECVVIFEKINSVGPPGATDVKLFGSVKVDLLLGPDSRSEEEDPKRYKPSAEKGNDVFYQTLYEGVPYTYAFPWSSERPTQVNVNNADVNLFRFDFADKSKKWKNDLPLIHRSELDPIYKADDPVLVHNWANRLTEIGLEIYVERVEIDGETADLDKYGRVRLVVTGDDFDKSIKNLKSGGIKADGLKRAIVNVGKLTIPSFWMPAEEVASLSGKIKHKGKIPAGNFTIFQQSGGGKTTKGWNYVTLGFADYDGNGNITYSRPLYPGKYKAFGIGPCPLPGLKIYSYKTDWKVAVDDIEDVHLDYAFGITLGECPKPK